MLPPPDDGHEACSSRPGNKESRAGEGWPAGLLSGVAGGRTPGYGQQEHEVNKHYLKSQLKFFHNLRLPEISICHCFWDAIKENTDFRLEEGIYLRLRRAIKFVTGMSERCEEVPLSCPKTIPALDQKH